MSWRGLTLLMVLFNRPPEFYLNKIVDMYIELQEVINYCQALVPNPKPINPQSLQTQSQPNPTQFETQINHKKVQKVRKAKFMLPLGLNLSTPSLVYFKNFISYFSSPLSTNLVFSLILNFTHIFLVSRRRLVVLKSTLAFISTLYIV